MKKEKSNRKKWVTVRLTEQEKAQLIKQFKQTTERQMSTYARNILLGKPMIKAVRDQSLQDVLAVLTDLRKDFNGLANNLNQTVHKLHTMEQYPEVKAWLMLFEISKKKTFDSIETIKSYINQTAEKWLRS